MGWESFGLVRFDFGPLVQGQTMIDKRQSACNLFIIGPRCLGIMGWESFGELGFDLGSLLQGQMKIAKVRSVYNLLNIGPKGLGW